MGMFSDLANVKGTDVKPPVTLPEGHYTAQHTGLAREHKAKSGNTAARFPFKVVAPGEDVDAEELEAAGGLPDKENYIDFYMSENARFMFVEYACSQGLPRDMDLLSMIEEIGQSGKTFTVQVKHTPMQDRDGNPVLNTDGTPRMRVEFVNPVGLEG